MSITDWFTNLGPKRKFAIKSIAKIAAVSVPVIGDQLHALFETAFDELKNHAESDPRCGEAIQISVGGSRSPWPHWGRPRG